MRDRKSSGQVLCMCDWNVPYAIETDKQICLEKLIFLRVFSLSKHTETLVDHITFLKWQFVLDVAFCFNDSSKTTKIVIIDNDPYIEFTALKWS